MKRILKGSRQITGKFISNEPQVVSAELLRVLFRLCVQKASARPTEFISCHLEATAKV